MVMRDVHTNKEVLECAIIDAINQFVREFVEPQELMGKTPSAWDRKLFIAMKHRVAKEVAAHWEHCRIDEDA